MEQVVLPLQKAPNMFSSGTLNAESELIPLRASYSNRVNPLKPNAAPSEDEVSAIYMSSLPLAYPVAKVVL